MKNADNLIPTISFAIQKDWEIWLEKHHSDTRGVWLKLAKKESGISSITYPEALEVAICYGWIDGQKGSIDAKFWKQKFTPRTQKSPWSKINRDRVESLITQGRMKPSGLEQVKLAKADGRWERAYESQSKISVPSDLRRELDKNPKADEFFATLNSVNRYAILHRIQIANRKETRAARITKFVDMLEKGRKIYP